MLPIMYVIVLNFALDKVLLFSLSLFFFCKI